MKLSILIQNGSLAGQQRELTAGALTVGREPSCNLQFDVGERLISKQHASIQAEPDGFYVVDNNSTNGTFVNGQKISRAKLSSGDTIHFGGRDGVKAAVNIEMPVQNQQYSAPNNNYNYNAQSAGYVPPAAESYQQNYAGSYGGYQSGQRQSIGDSLTNRVFFYPDAKPAGQNTAKYIGIAAAIIVAVFLALVITGFTLLELGIVAAFVATIAAFIPAFFYILPLLWLDRYDPEPPVNLAIAFAWGALVAVFFSLIINSIIGAILGPAVAAVISAPVFEEAFKGLGVLLFLIFWRKEFDGIVDGLVYAGVVALGFATVENVLYYGRALQEAGVAGLGLVMFLRGVMSPFAHVIFTSMIGIGCGISRETHNKVLRFIAPVLGYFAAVFIHALWNGIATFAGLYGFLIAYVILGIPFFLIFVGFAVYVMRRENKILKQTLTVEVAKGLITQEQMETATSAVRSLGWMAAGAGSGKLRARYKFMRAVARLGLAWWHIQRAQAAQGETRSLGNLHRFESEVRKWQPQI
jgi:protease PrsW